MLQGPPSILDGTPPNEAPDIGVKAAELLSHLQENLCVLHGGFDLEPIAHDARVRQKPFDFSRIKARDFLGVEVVERATIILPLLQNRDPTQSGLRSFENEKLKQQTVVMHWHAPLAVVIHDRQFVSRPRTAGSACW